MNQHQSGRGRRRADLPVPPPALLGLAGLLVEIASTAVSQTHGKAGMPTPDHASHTVSDASAATNAVHPGARWPRKGTRKVGEI
jgi:hypothetical protein